MNIKQQGNQASTDPTPETWSLPKITYKYDDFTPAHDWRAGEGSDVLLLALPGFTAKEIRTSLDPAGIIKVSGSHFVGNGTYSRFTSEFRIPEDGSRTGIQRKFDNGILFIIIPKKNPFPSTTQKEKSNLTSAETQSEPPQSSLPSKPSESQLAQPFSPEKQLAKQTQPHPAPQQSSPQPQSPFPMPLQQNEEIQPPLPSQLNRQVKQQLSQIQPDGPDPQIKANTLGVETDKMLSRKHNQEPSEKFCSENHEKELNECGNPISCAERILKGGTGKGKEISATWGTAEEMETPRKEYVDNEARQKQALIGARISGELKIESYIKLARDQLSGERRTLLNMGAAVLVIAGLGVYVCCKIRKKINSK